LASQGHVTTYAECKIVNTEMADDNSVWPWRRSRVTPCSQGRQAVLHGLHWRPVMAKLWMK